MNHRSTLMLSLMASHHWLTTGVSATLHFLVDGLCVCCLYLMADSGSLPRFLGVVMLYNVLAFLTQPLTGMLADRVRWHHQLLLMAVMLLSMAVALASFLISHSSFLIYSVAVFLGMGNSLFHVWGGKQTAVLTDNDACALGVFVAPGAFGLAVGMVMHAWWLLYLFLLLIVLFTLAGIQAPALHLSLGEGQTVSGKSSTSLSSNMIWTTLLLLMGFVVFRSYLGETLTAGVAKGAAAMLLIGGVSMMGKAVGGWLSRSVGLTAVFIVAFVGSLVCLWMKGSMEWLWLLGLLLINGTMAVTLCWANGVMKGREGLAFGLLAAALMPGYMVAMAGAEMSFVLPRLLLTLVPTVAIELAVLWSLHEHRADVLCSSIVVNILTNIPLNLFLLYVSDSWSSLVVGELFVLMVEALWYRYFTDGWSRAFAYSALCNGISFFTGLLVQLVMLMF